MPLSWESIYSLFSPPATRDLPSEGITSLFSGFFSKADGSDPTKQAGASMGPKAGHSAAASLPVPSPAASSTSSLASSERDYFPPSSPQSQSQRSPSISSASTGSSEQQQQQLLLQPDPPQRTHTTPAPTTSDDAERPAAPRRSATHVVALDPMSREYPKPTQELSLDEMLARKPGKHSLSHYLQNPKESRISLEPRTDEERAERARKFEEIKQNLRMERERIAALVEKR
ncbi:hypothetical protein VTH82DRAFT_790 [Thermothelomyces myriococcoides]